MTSEQVGMVQTTASPSWIAKRQLLVYCLLAFSISWIFWFIEPLFRPSDPLTAVLLVQLGTFGPVLAAMLVSCLTDRIKVDPHRWLGWLAAGLALAVAGYCNGKTVLSLPLDSITPLQWTLLGILTLLPAWLFFNVASRFKGVRDLLGSLVRWKTSILWFLAALFIMSVIGWAGVLLTALITHQPLSTWTQAFLANPIFSNFPLVFLATALYGGPLGEEAGWRGFVLPRLQKRFDPLLASVILGAIWATWHLPLHLTGYYNAAFGNPLNGILMRLVTTIPLTLIFTWLYNRSHGNLLLMVLLHTAVNITSALIPTGFGLYITTFLAVVFMVVLDRMYRRPDTAQSRYRGCR